MTDLVGDRSPDMKSWHWKMTRNATQPENHKLMKVTRGQQ